jgi:hypothetical protein
MIFAKKKMVWCDDPPEDPVISVFAGCLANHDRAHSLLEMQKKRDDDKWDINMSEFDFNRYHFSEW